MSKDTFNNSHIRLLRLACAVAFSLTLNACSSSAFLAPQPDEPVPTPDLSGLEIFTPGENELIFSGVKGTSSDAQTVTLKNTGDAPLELNTLALSGTDAAAFALAVPSLPLVIEPNSALDVAVAFTPDVAGRRSARLQIAGSGGAAASIGLYGLGSEGEQGENEPPLQEIVATLGYAVEVGSSTLVLGDSDEPIGDEVIAPLFEKAGTGPVTLEVVARYGPEEDFPYGFFTLDAARPVLREVGLIEAVEAQKLLPRRTSGSATFDPGTDSFGIYGQAGGGTQYSLGGLNTGEIAHALRVYPLKDRSGDVVPGSYLIGLEEAANGDYQDALFVISNVRPSFSSNVQ